MRSKVEELAAGYKEPKEVIEHYMGNKQLLSGIENMVLEDLVVELVLSKAAVEDRAVSYQDVISKAEESDGE